MKNFLVNKAQKLRTKARQIGTQASNVGIAVGVLAVSMAPAQATTALTTAITAKVTEAENFGYGILAIALVARIGFNLIKGWGKSAAK